jgi:hypothetical protein
VNRAFVFSRTNTVVAPDIAASPGIASAIRAAVLRTVIVKTPVLKGAGAILGDRVITSLFLVANETEVIVQFHNGGDVAAFVTRKDTEQNLAELWPASRMFVHGRRIPLTSSPHPKIGVVDEMGNPLLVVNVATGTPQINVAGTFYGIRVRGRFEESWRINPYAPKGIIGGGVWNTDGRFVGLAIGEKMPFMSDDSPQRPFPRVYALPGEEVMEFAESSR